MCTDIDYIPQLMMITDKDLILTNDYDRRNSWAPSISSSSSSSTRTNNSTNSSSWLERKLLSHIKRFFRRNSSPTQSDTADSSRRTSLSTEEILSKPVIEEIQIENDEEIKPQENDKVLSVDVPPTEQTESNPPQDTFYNYDYLLARCLQRQEQDRSELISRCQTPVTIPHADLTIGHSRTILNNWKSYVRLFRALNREPHLFQQYINQYFQCQSSINQREQLTFNIRTTKRTIDNLLKQFLHEYVTCLACQKAQTHLIKSTGLWGIECQLCGSQRSVRRLRWKSNEVPQTNNT